jgi:phenylacetate-CoA ligase
MFYRKLLENLILPLGDLALGTNYISSLKKWRKIQTLNETEVFEIQKNNLFKLLNHATASVPFYKEMNISKMENPYQWIKSFPIINKQVIKDNLDSMIIGNKNNLVIEKSSGSSGIQGAVYLTKKEVSQTQAIQTLWWEWAGYQIGNSLIQTGITPYRGLVKSIKDFLFRTDYVIAFGVSEDFVVKTLLKLRKYPKNHFVGYASSLYVFAQVAKKNNINDVSFISVISWGDKMFAHYKQLIEQQFTTTVFDTYGCTEGFMIAAQNERPDYYQMSPHVYLEILNDIGEEVNPGEWGKVVVTRLDALAMPMIRYTLGDLAIMGERKKRENYLMPFPIIEKIIGRDTDVVKTASGKYMVVHSFTGLFEHYYAEIKQYRVIQRSLDGIEIEIIPDMGFSDAILKDVQKKIQAYLQEEFPISFKIVDFIPSTASGKPQIIQSFLNNNI